MSIEDQTYDRISGLVLNRIAHSFGQVSDDIADAFFDAVGTKMTYEEEVTKILGSDSAVLDRANLIALAEEITLVDLFSDVYDCDEKIHDYLDKFPVEIQKWRTHLLTFID